jgi:hypothetical protein
MVRMPIINPWSRSLIPKLIGKWGVDTLVRRFKKSLCPDGREP